MPDSEETFIIVGCPNCRDVYRWRPGPSGLECLGIVPEEELVARALRGQLAGYWLCMECQKKLSAGKLPNEQ